MARDSIRHRVYRAERGLHGTFFSTLAETRVYAARVEASPWWVRNSRHFGPVTVVERNAKRGNATYATGVIRLPRTCWYEMYLLHELAHLAHGVPHWHEGGHSSRYVAVLHSLVAEFMGPLAATRYRRACMSQGIATTAGLPVTPAEEATADHVHYRESYRRYRLGQRATPPNLRKGMTARQAAAIRQRVDMEVYG